MHFQACWININELKEVKGSGQMNLFDSKMELTIAILQRQKTFSTWTKGVDSLENDISSKISLILDKFNSFFKAGRVLLMRFTPHLVFSGDTQPDGDGFGLISVVHAQQIKFW